MFLLEILWMIIRLCLPWFIVAFIGKSVHTYFYIPYMEKKEEVFGSKLRGFLEKLLLGFISFLVIGTLCDMNLLPGIAKDSILWFIYYTFSYSSPIMIIMFVVTFIKTKDFIETLKFVLIIYGMGILLLPYTYFLFMKMIGKYVLKFLGFTFEEALNDSATNGVEYRCPNCGAQIYQSGECVSCGSYITIT